MSGKVFNIIGSILDPLDTSKSFDVSLSGSTSGVSNTFSFSSTANRVYGLPDSNTTLVGADTVQTLTNKTISGASNTITNIDASTSINAGSVNNSLLTNSSLTVAAGTGLSGGGAVSLGGTVTLANAGVTSLTGTANQINASSSTGTVTLSLSQPSSSIISASSAISTSETYISASFPIGAATIAAGDSFSITIYGTCTSSSSAGAPTFNIRFGTAGTITDTLLLSSSYTSAASGTDNVFCWTGTVTFRSTTTAIASSILSNNGIVGLSTTSSVSTIGSVASGLTTASAFLGVSFVTSSASTTATFQQVIVNRIR